jgi:hypothetical protein
MALRKPKSSTKPVDTDRVGGDARVAKRPQRGSHRYKDGTLNVGSKNKAGRDNSVTQAVLIVIARWIAG